MKAIVAENLVKIYPQGKELINAVQGVSFAVAPGELFGIIGPDGAGKTSLFRMLTTLLLPDGGSATVDGFDVVKDFKAIRQRVGYMPGKFSLYPDLTVAENLEFFATIFHTNIVENYSLIEDIYGQIAPFKDRRAGKLSGGMKQKLALCCALIHKPSVLFLDEPTTGVDAVSRKEFWDMLQHLKKQGITILVSTPYMDEATLCDRVALLQSGKILAINTPANIINAFAKSLLAVRADDMFPFLQELKTLPGIEDAYAFGDYHHVVVAGNLAETRDRITRLPHPNIVVQPVRPNIEDCFISLMKD
ncbi:MAG: Efflux ABC transporter, ATP-binding protein [uncultured Adhaeribacter sp.]|uniref:Efflux ABC transporter, ATP-binding protein n=1 Tax=uncultured Adhaeribacter sp. TaxID=448109 RepID=A0A6J4JIP4_9BACT|nr:MAG: Efflux ABC transporter, ATP-binding protein [uncultured Adhaeribacter sp.]